MDERVTVTVERGVADVRLNRPDKLNALDPAMFKAIVATGEGLKADRSVRAVVLSGMGRGFCAGLDFGAVLSLDGGDAGSVLGRTDERITHLGQQAAYVWQELEVPVIAAVHGVAL